MPPLPIIDRTFRVTFNITSATRPAVHNTIHVRTDVATSAPDLGAALSTFLGGAGLDNLLQPLPTDYSLTSLEILPLNGVTAGHIQPAGASWPAGLQTGDIIPEASVLVTIRSLLRGPSGRGRLFVGPVTESVVSGGVPLASMLTTMTTAWEFLRTGMGGIATSAELVVASYTHAIANDATQCVARTYVGLQRRRLTRLR